MGAERFVVSWKVGAKDGEMPWEYGLKNPSPAAVSAWKALSHDERLLISRHNPFRQARNDTLREMRDRGLTQETISEISGLCINSIREITKKRDGKQH